MKIGTLDFKNSKYIVNGLCRHSFVNVDRARTTISSYEKQGWEFEVADDDLMINTNFDFTDANGNVISKDEAKKTLSHLF